MPSQLKRSTKEPVQIRSFILNENGKKEETRLDVLLPHHVLAYLFNNLGVEVREEDCQHFWREQRERGVPWATEHPATGSHVPCGIYYDACTFLVHNMVIQEKLFAIWMNVLLWRPRSSRASRFLVFTLRTDLIVDYPTTIFPILRAIVYSFNKASPISS
jgi:hypothetical protein